MSDPDSDGAITEAAVDTIVAATVGKAAAKVAEKGAAAVRQARIGGHGGGSGCACGCSSFHADTPVVLQYGTKPIAEVEVGDLVLAVDPVTGEPSYELVTALHQSRYDETYHIWVQGDDGTTTEILASFNHPFFAVIPPGEPQILSVSTYGLTYEGPIEGGTWLDARDIREGTLLREADGTLQVVVATEMRRSPLAAHNLTVENLHTYFVGSDDDAVWVHNCPEEPSGGVYSLRDPETGQVMRNGHTNDLKRREGEHNAPKSPTRGLVLTPEARTDDLPTRRGLEERLIEAQRGPLDKQRGISPRNKRRDEYL